MAMKVTGAGDRLVALFLLGLALFSPPALAIFNFEVLIAGMPVLFVYLFGAWLALVVLIAVTLRPRARDAQDADAGPIDEMEGR